MPVSCTCVIAVSAGMVWRRKTKVTLTQQKPFADYAPREHLAFRGGGVGTKSSEAIGKQFS